MAMALLVGYRYHSIPVPENFENPLLYRTFTVIFDVTAGLVNLYLDYSYLIKCFEFMVFKFPIQNCAKTSNI